MKFAIEHPHVNRHSSSHGCGAENRVGGRHHHPVFPIAEEHEVPIVQDSLVGWRDRAHFATGSVQLPLRRSGPAATH